MIPSTINPDLYARLPPDKKEEYKALFPDPAKIRYPVYTPVGWAWCDNEFFIIPGYAIEIFFFTCCIYHQYLSSVNFLSRASAHI